MIAELGNHAHVVGQENLPLAATVHQLPDETDETILVSSKWRAQIVDLDECPTLRNLKPIRKMRVAIEVDSCGLRARLGHACRADDEGDDGTDEQVDERQHQPIVPG